MSVSAKTEVAFARCPSLPAMDGKQVAVLVPTTLRAEQHFQNFSNGFATCRSGSPSCRVSAPRKKQTQALKDMEYGQDRHRHRTHKLIQKGVKSTTSVWSSLTRTPLRRTAEGTLKALRAEVDVLDADPHAIPRTLAMSLEGLRDFSSHRHPPQRRLSIKTFVCANSNGIIRRGGAARTERGGQVYFLHTRWTPSQHGEKLETLLPEARIAWHTADGRARDLEQVCAIFTSQRFQCAAVHHHHRNRHRIPDRQHILMNRAGPLRPRSLHHWRPRRALAPSGLRLSAGRD